MRLSYRILFFILIPVICLPIALVKTTKPLLCLYMLVVLAAFWSLDVLPYGVTSLIPILFAPLMGIESSQVIAQTYASDALFLCLGRLMLACAYKRHQIHRRFSLFLLTKFGPQPRMIMLSCMLPCYVLTMFISKAATAPIMLEFVLEILQELKEIEEGEQLDSTENPEYSHYGSINTPILGKPPRYTEDYNSLTMNDDYPSMTNVIERVKEIPSRKSSKLFQNHEESSEKFKSFSLALSLCTGYAASCGAVGTLVASGCNLVAYGVLVKNKAVANLNYATFLVAGLPLSVVVLIVTWLWIGNFHIGLKEFFAIRKNTPKEEIFKERVRLSFQKLGKIKFSEMSCLGLTLFVIIMWISRNIQGHGWGCAFRNVSANNGTSDCDSQYVSDATPMVFVIFLLFIWPTKWDFWRKVDTDDPGYERLLTWEYTHNNLPWAIVFLLGTGFAITEICTQSGFAKDVGIILKGLLQGKTDYVIVLIVATLQCVTTEFLSSTTILPVYITVFIELAQATGRDYFRYVFPLIFSASFAFCLPASTTPNIAIFNRGLATTKQMIKAGILMDIVFILLTSTFTYLIVFNFKFRN